LATSCIQFFRILAGVDKLNPGNAGVPNAKANENSNEVTISGDRLAELLNEDLAREYQAIIASVVYSQALNGAEYMSIADQLQLHAAQELQQALTLSRSTTLAKCPPSLQSWSRTMEMLRFDLDNDNETVCNYRDRVRQCGASASSHH